MASSRKIAVFGKTAGGNNRLNRLDMAVRKINNTWWVDFMFNYERHRKRSPENSRTGALAYDPGIRVAVCVPASERILPNMATRGRNSNGNAEGAAGE
jgi:hypothetical protein